ncbi:hypothetical protein [Lacticaseibacillus absianus]|uniref:hypothetical protein n=1 Tax=Lacticaseibacillus absianus TaxID=2729623 RepID=UPI0015C8E44B|nr:hypothetical protein [Lacticaseibacillus absianus]
MTVKLRIWRPADSGSDSYVTLTATMATKDYERWMKGNQGSVRLIVDDGRWLAVRLVDIMEIGEPEWRCGEM